MLEDECGGRIKDQRWMSFLGFSSVEMSFELF